MDGESCTTFDNWGKGFDTPTLTGYIKEWSKLTDKLGIWYYASSDGLASMSVLHTVRGDMKLLYDIGVRQVYWENKSNPYDTNLISQWLSYQMYWDVNMSEERFDELYDRILRIQFGDAAESVKYYITLYDSSYKYGPCRHAWNGFTDVPPENAAPFNRDALAKTFDTMFETLEAAIPLADSEKQEAHVIKLQCTDIFTGCLSAYPKAKEAGDTERMKTLEDRYALIEARLRKYGVNMEKGIPDNVTKIYHSKLTDYFPG